MSSRDAGSLGAAASVQLPVCSGGRHLTAETESLEEGGFDSEAGSLEVGMFELKIFKVESFKAESRRDGACGSVLPRNLEFSLAPLLALLEC